MWLVSISCYLESVSTAYEEWGWKKLGIDGSLYSQLDSTQPSYFMPSSSHWPFDLRLCRFWIQMPTGFSLWYLACPVLLSLAGDRVTFVSKESHDFPGKTKSQLFQWVSPQLLFWAFSFLSIWYWRAGAEDFHNRIQTSLLISYFSHFNFTISFLLETFTFPIAFQNGAWFSTPRQGIIVQISARC